MTIIDKYKQIKDKYPEQYLSINKNIDSDIVKTLEDISALYRTYKNDNVNKHKELLNYYNKIVKETGKFLKEEVGDTDEIKLCAALSELVWEGKISFPKEFKYSTDINPLEELFCLNGINVLYGKGCCRNISVLFKDILNNLRYNIKTINNCEYQTTTNTLNTDTYRYDIEGNIINESIYHFDASQEIKPNHECIIFLYKLKHMLVYDPINISIYKLNGIHGKMLYGDGKILIYPHSLMTENNYTYNDMNNFVYNLELLKKFNKSNPTNIKELFNDGIKSISSNKSITDDFYESILPTLKEVNEYRLKKLLKK